LTVIRLNRRRFSGTIETPRSTRLLVDQSVTTSPSRSTSPDDGLTMPRIVFSVVVLPDALPPSRQTISPAKTSRFTSLRT
jgi:hypothetical protein